MKTGSFLEVIISSSNEVFKDFESDKAVGIGQLGNPTRKTAESNDIAKHTAGSSILTRLLHVKTSDL